MSMKAATVLWMGRGSIRVPDEDIPAAAREIRRAFSEDDEMRAVLGNFTVVANPDGDNIHVEIHQKIDGGVVEYAVPRDEFQACFVDRLTLFGDAYSAQTTEVR